MKIIKILALISTILTITSCGVNKHPQIHSQYIYKTDTLIKIKNQVEYYHDSIYIKDSTGKQYLDSIVLHDTTFYYLVKPEYHTIYKEKISYKYIDSSTYKNKIKDNVINIIQRDPKDILKISKLKNQKLLLLLIISCLISFIFRKPIIGFFKYHNLIK